MYRAIIKSTVSRRYMPDTKASRDGEKITVTLTTWDGSNYTDLRVVFHHDKVFITEIEYRTKFNGERYRKVNCRITTKHSHPFDMLRFGYTYDGKELDKLALCDIALKLYTNKNLDINSDGKLILKFYN